MAKKQRATRDRLCEAAIRAASEKGLLALTLDNVAREAGVSKGGVMYHFPSKRELVQAMIEYFGSQVEQMLLRNIAEDPVARGRWARALLRSIFPIDQAPKEADAVLGPEAIDRFLLSALAAAVNDPGVIEPLREVGRRLQKRLLADPVDGMDQILIWLALDGLFLWQFVGLIDRKDELFGQVVSSLWNKVAPAEPEPTAGPAPAARKPRKGKRT